MNAAICIVWSIGGISFCVWNAIFVFPKLMFLNKKWN